MQGPSVLELVGFSPEGWGAALLVATGMTLAVATGGFAAGSVIGAGITSAKLSRSAILRTFGDSYTTVLRGIPDLLVIYLFYFGGSAALGTIGGLFGVRQCRKDFHMETGGEVCTLLAGIYSCSGLEHPDFT